MTDRPPRLVSGLPANMRLPGGPPSYVAVRPDGAAWQRRFGSEAAAWRTAVKGANSGSGVGRVEGASELAAPRHVAWNRLPEIDATTIPACPTKWPSFGGSQGRVTGWWNAPAAGTGGRRRSADPREAARRVAALPGLSAIRPAWAGQRAWLPLSGAVADFTAAIASAGVVSNHSFRTHDRASKRQLRLRPLRPEERPGQKRMSFRSSYQALV